MKFVFRQSMANDQWYWQLKGSNGEPIAHSEAYLSRDGCLHAIRQVKSAFNAPVEEEAAKQLLSLRKR